MIYHWSNRQAWDSRERNLLVIHFQQCKTDFNQSFHKFPFIYKSLINKTKKAEFDVVKSVWIRSMTIWMIWHQTAKCFFLKARLVLPEKSIFCKKKTQTYHISHSLEQNLLSAFSKRQQRWGFCSSFLLIFLFLFLATWKPANSSQDSTCHWTNQPSGFKRAFKELHWQFRSRASYLPQHNRTTSICRKAISGEVSILIMKDFTCWDSICRFIWSGRCLN